MAEYHLILSGGTLEFTHIFYVNGTDPITVPDSGLYTKTAEDANVGYARLKNEPTPTQPVQPIAPTAQTVNPTASKVFINGEEQSFEAYNIGGSNYFKLRDLAFVLNGTNKQFDVGYDNATKAITMTSGQPYVPTGGEMTLGNGQAKPATPTASKIYLDGRELSFTVYNIGGNNFFKLVDLMSALNIGVTYNETTRNIGIDTSVPYSGVITQAS
jgi:hypothetical protein